MKEIQKPFNALAIVVDFTGGHWLLAYNMRFW